MSDQSWVPIQRKLFKSDMWLSETFSRGQAWVDLIGLTNYKPGHIRVAGEKVDIPRGVCGWSQVRLGERWKWSRGKTRRFLGELESSGMIVQQKTRRTTLISIVNYNEYQLGGFRGGTTDSTTDGTAGSTTDGQQTVQQTDTNKEFNNNKKYKKSVFVEEKKDAHAFFKLIPGKEVAQIDEILLKGDDARQYAEIVEWVAEQKSIIVGKSNPGYKKALRDAFRDDKTDFMDNYKFVKDHITKPKNKPEKWVYERHINDVYEDVEKLSADEYSRLYDEAIVNDFEVSNFDKNSYEAKYAIAKILQKKELDFA